MKKLLDEIAQEKKARPPDHESRPAVFINLDTSKAEIDERYLMKQETVRSELVRQLEESGLYRADTDR